MAEDHRKKKTGFFIHLSDGELKMLKTKSEKAHMTRTEYTRKILFTGEVQEKKNFSRDDADRLQFELNRIGNAVNQIAYQANNNRSVSKNDSLQLQEELNHMLALCEKFVLE